ncbi:MAG TPA: zf-HC2 domain-containing protein [Acidobacteriota bacterium]|nr:zf-HC2 domain-containing protein [Acidobacteriota bacterium]
MSCAEIKDELKLFLSGKLSGERSRRVRTHLATCAQCASELSAPDRIEGLVALDEAIEPSSEFESRFSARLDAHRRKQGATPDQPSLRERILAWSLSRQLAAAGVLAAFLALGIYIGMFRDRLQAPVATVTEVSIAENLPLLQDMAVIENLDLLEDFDTIQGLNSNETKPSMVR